MTQGKVWEAIERGGIPLKVSGHLVTTEPADKFTVTVLARNAEWGCNVPVTEIFRALGVAPPLEVSAA